MTLKSKNKNFIKQITILTVFFFAFITCSIYKPIISDKNNEIHLNEDFEKIVTITELYEICEKEKISTNLKEWASISFGNDDDSVSQWFYLKEDNKRKTYLLTKDSDTTYTIKIKTLN